MELRIPFRFIPTVLVVGGLILLGIQAAVIRPMFVDQHSAVDFVASFVAIQFASFMAFTSVLNGVRLWRIGQRNSMQDRFAMMLMALMGFALFILIVAWVS